MANELQAYLSTGNTVYAVLLNSVGAVWNGSTFDTTPTAAEWGNYDIAMTELTSLGIYRANMPTSTAGVYNYLVYKQIGASPATTDTLVGIGYVDWDGSAVLPLSAIDTALTTVDTNVDSILTDTGTSGVLISSGTGTGQISLSSGKVLLQATQTGVTIPTVTTVGTTTNLTNLPTMPTDWITATGLSAGAVTEIQTGLATPTNITAGTITTVGTTTNLTNAPTNGDFTATMKSSITTAATSATPALSAAGVDAILDEVVVGTYTMRQILEITGAVLAGKVSGGGTSSISFTGLDNTSGVVVATVDTNGNRSSVTITV